MNGTISATVTQGEVFQVHAEVAGNLADAPHGLKMFMRFRPDYGN